MRFQSTARDLPFLRPHFSPLSAGPDPDPYCKVAVRITLEI